MCLLLGASKTKIGWQLKPFGAPAMQIPLEAYFAMPGLFLSSLARGVELQESLWWHLLHDKHARTAAVDV